MLRKFFLSESSLLMLSKPLQLEKLLLEIQICSTKGRVARGRGRGLGTGIPQLVFGVWPGSLCPGAASLSDEGPCAHLMLRKFFLTDERPQPRWASTPPAASQSYVENQTVLPRDHHHHLHNPKEFYVRKKTASMAWGCQILRTI